jgi:hypothetical protein
MKIEKQIKKKKFRRVRLGLFERARPVTLRETCVFGLCFFFFYKGWITCCSFFFLLGKTNKDDRSLVFVLEKMVYTPPKTQIHNLRFALHAAHSPQI